YEDDGRDGHGAAPRRSQDGDARGQRSDDHRAAHACGRGRETTLRDSGRRSYRGCRRHQQDLGVDEATDTSYASEGRTKNPGFWSATKAFSEGKRGTEEQGGEQKRSFCSPPEARIVWKRGGVREARTLP